MTLFRVEVNGSLYTVSVERSSADRFLVTLNGLSFEAEATSGSELTRWLLKGESETIRGQSRRTANDRVDVWLECTPFQGSVQTLGASGLYVGSAKRDAKTGGQVRALMPGRITSVLVKEGEEVKLGSPLLILEAMKMQNEITSPSNGTVKTVVIHEGQTVKKDTLLVIIE